MLLSSKATGSWASVKEERRERVCVRERETEKGRMRVVTNRDVMSLADTKVIATATTNHRTINVTEYRHISESVCQWCDVMLCDRSVLYLLSPPLSARDSPAVPQ